MCVISEPLVEPNRITKSLCSSLTFFPLLFSIIFSSFCHF